MMFVCLLFKDYTSQILLHQLQRESSKQMEIYSNDQNNLPPKLRLPLTPGKPSPIVVLAREGFYFSYDTEPNPIHCDRNRPNCPKSSITFSEISQLVLYLFFFAFLSFS